MPAVALAKEGFPVDWYVALLITAAARHLARDPDAAARFLDDGRWLKFANWTALSNLRIVISSMSPTLLVISYLVPPPLFHFLLSSSLPPSFFSISRSLLLPSFLPFFSSF